MRKTHKYIHGTFVTTDEINPLVTSIKKLPSCKQYMQMLRDLRDQNIIKVLTGVHRCGKSSLLQILRNA